jgi:hypothetical protein
LTVCITRLVLISSNFIAKCHLNVTSYCVSLDSLNMRCIGKSGIKDLMLIRLILVSRYYIGGLGWWCLAPLSTIWRSVLLTEQTGVPGENHQVTDVMEPTIIRGRTRRCRDCMVVGFITTYICNQCLSPLTLWVRIPLRRAAFYTTLCDKVCQWLGGFLQVLRFAPSIKLTAILLKVALSTITLTPQYNTVKLISI